jgi:thiol-disulfide isomerase/thioredoxin
MVMPRSLNVDFVLKFSLVVASVVFCGYSLHVFRTANEVNRTTAGHSESPVRNDTLYCELPDHDCGDVMIGDVELHSFRLQNASGRVQQIAVDVGCSCARVEDFTEAINIGDSGFVTIAMKGSGRPGIRKSQIVVRSDDPGTRPLVLTATCTVTPAVVVAPVPIRLDCKEGLTGVATLTSMARGETMRVRRLDPDRSMPFLRASFNEIRKGREYAVDFAGDPGSVPFSGRRLGIVNAVLEGTAQEETTFPVLIVNESSVYSDPPELNFRFADGDRQLVKISIRSRIDSEVVVRGVALTAVADAVMDTPVQFTVTDAEKGSVTIELANLALADLNGRQVRLTTSSGPVYLPVTLQRRPETPAKQDVTGRRVPVTGMLIDGSNYPVDIHTGRPVVVAFWASWCNICRRDLPLLAQLERHYADQGVTFVGVNLDKDVEDARRVILSEGIRWPTIHSAADQYALSQRFSVSRIPTVFLLDSSGTVTARCSPQELEDRLANLKNDVQ